MGTDRNGCFRFRGKCDKFFTLFPKHYLGNKENLFSTGISWVLTGMGVLGLGVSIQSDQWQQQGKSVFNRNLNRTDRNGCFRFRGKCDQVFTLYPKHYLGNRENLFSTGISWGLTGMGVLGFGVSVIKFLPFIQVIIWVTRKICFQQESQGDWPEWVF